MLGLLLKLLLRVRLKLFLLASRRGLRLPPLHPTDMFGFASSSARLLGSPAPDLAAAALITPSASASSLPSLSSSSELRKGLSTIGSDLGYSRTLSAGLPPGEKLAAALAITSFATEDAAVWLSRVGKGMGSGAAGSMMAFAVGGGRWKDVGDSQKGSGCMQEEERS